MFASMMIFAIVLIQVLFILSTDAQTFHIKRCPNTRVVPNFDVRRYMGKWYEIEKFRNLFQSGSCTTANYGPIDSSGRVQVINKELTDKNQVSAVRGHAKQSKLSGDLEVKLIVPFSGEQSSDYDVLGTDYDNWALVHACRQIGPLAVEFAWVLSRQPSLTQAHLDQINRIILVNGLNKNDFEVTRQLGCPNLDLLPYKFIA